MPKQKMKQPMLRCLLLLSVLLSPSWWAWGKDALAQTWVSERRISTASGLSNNFVLSMTADAEGNVWVGTEAGLNRIAGTSVSVYRREQLGSSNDKILSLFYDARSACLLIGTERGLLVHDPRKDTFIPNTHGDTLIVSVLADIVDDHKGGAWLVYGNGAIQHYDTSSGQVGTLPVDLPGGRTAMDDGQGHLYVGHSKEGMSIVDLGPQANVRRFVHQEQEPGGLPGNNVRCIKSDGLGRVWVGTDRGLAQFDPLTATFSPLLQPSLANEGHFYHNVFGLCQLASGHLWVATDVGGVLCSDGSHVETSSKNTRCILQDAYHNVWIGNHSTGVDFIPFRKPFMHMLDYLDQHHRPMRVYGVAGDAAGHIWLSAEDELSLWTTDGAATDGLRCEGKWLITGMKHRAHSFARCLMADSRGFVWLGMEDEGVIRFDTRAQRFEPIDIGYDVCDVHSFYEDEGGRVWIGAEYGVCIYDHGRISHAETVDELTKKAPVTSFVRLSDNRLLLTTQGNGLVVYDAASSVAQTLTMADGLPSNNISQALADAKRGIWLATNEGLVLLPSADDLKRFEVYGVRAGLPDHQVRAILQDGQGRIWASTPTSIVCLDNATGRFHNYSQLGNPGIGGFMEGACATAADGSMVFGSPGGACYFHPRETAAMRRVSPVRIALCEVYSPTEDGNRVQRCRPDADGQIAADYQQNTLRIAYTVGDYAQVDDVEYSYLMRGLNDEWYYNGTDHDVMFRSLRPGKYEFVLRAKLKSQDWSDAATTRLSIRIAPPLWQTWWAHACYLLLAVAFFAVVIRQYKRRLALKNSLEMTRRESLQKQELNEERLQFFTNITHELRTPLTLILGPLEDLAQDSLLPEGSKKKVEMINKSAQRLRDLISEILEFRKTETQNRRLTVARGDLGQFVREIVLNYEELNRNARVTILQDIAEGLPAVYFDSEIITTVLNNLLSNAVKYTEQGSITIGVRLESPQRLAISVADTGYGIAADALPHIFDRYYQAKGSHQASGTGIGLALVKSLADLHEARLGVESEEGKGSKFTFTLDVDNAYPGALHKEDRDVPAAKHSEKLDAAEEDGLEQEQPLLLIVEDNADIRQYVADTLADDYRILQAANGADGLSMAEEKMPDAIVCDVMMPRMNGIEMTRRLKADIRTCHIPIILLTAKDADQDREEGYESGADSYLTKPFTAKLLATRIRNLLTARRRLAEVLSGVVPPDAQEPFADSRLSRLDQDFIEKLNRVIEENIMQTDIDMAFLTDKMAMSHSTFYRKVKALTGLTAKEYVRKRKLRHCYRLLESGDYNVTEAAMMTGFNQMAHFRETFKNEFGLLPSEVRSSTGRGPRSGRSH